MPNDAGRSVPFIGDRFPAMKWQTDHGVMKQSDAFHGIWLILFSRSGDFTPVCITELVVFEKQWHSSRVKMPEFRCSFPFSVIMV